MFRACRLSMLVLALAGCTPQPPQTVSGPVLPPAALPQWRVGDRVSWSNGQTETVVAVNGEVVRWRDQDGNSYAGYRNFLLPSLDWDYPETRAVTEIPVAPDLLWPLRPGASAHFTVTQRLTRKIHDSETSYIDEWMCGVDGTEQVSVRLGAFDTWRLRCQRYWRGSNIGEIVWNYAPALGLPVRRTWTGADAPEEVVAIGHGTLDGKAERIAERVRQRGLDALPSGRLAVGRAGAVEASVRPVATYRAESGAWCRDFLQTVSAGPVHARTAGSACRGQDGTWQVVDRLKTPEED